MLLDAGADPNSKGRDDNTAVTIAALKGSNNLLTFLANHPKIDLSAQVYTCTCAVQHELFAEVYSIRTQVETQPYTVQCTPRITGV